MNLVMNSLLPPPPKEGWLCPCCQLIHHPETKSCDCRQKPRSTTVHVGGPVVRVPPVIGEVKGTQPFGSGGTSISACSGEQPRNAGDEPGDAAANRPELRFVKGEYVRLRTAIPECSLKAGEVGAVVNLSLPEHRFCEVRFVRPDGTFRASAWIEAGDLELAI